MEALLSHLADWLGPIMVGVVLALAGVHLLGEHIRFQEMQKAIIKKLVG